MAQVGAVVRSAAVREYERKRSLAAVVLAAPSRAEWVGWRTVARIISRGRRWIYRRAREGAWGAKQIPAQGRHGYAWRFRRSEVEAWVERFGRIA